MVVTAERTRGVTNKRTREERKSRNIERERERERDEREHTRGTNDTVRRETGIKRERGEWREKKSLCGFVIIMERGDRVGCDM